MKRHRLSRKRSRISGLYKGMYKRLRSGDLEIKVFLVDGFKIRNDFNIDFTEGGHYKRYSFIPKNEIWIENNVPVKERGFILAHELDELKGMLAGHSYENSHKHANLVEGYYRKKIN